MYNDKLVYKVVIWAFFRVRFWKEKVALRYCSDVCSGATCHKGNEISSGRNEYLFLSFK